MTLSAQGVALVAWVGASVAQVEALRADLMCIPGPQVLALLVQVGALAAGPVSLNAGLVLLVAHLDAKA